MNGKSSKFALGNVGWIQIVIVLVALVSAAWGFGFLPNQTVFSNDGPLGRLMAQAHSLPGRFSGCWQDLNIFGFREGTAVPGISTILMMVLRPVFYSKFYAPIGLIILGLGAWCFFRRQGFAPVACVAGVLATVANMDFFSTACWGVVAHPITIGMCFFALAALADTTSRLRWLRVALAGFAVGIGVIEGADVGAIFSLFVAGYAIYQAWVMDGSRVNNLAAGVGRVALVAMVAAIVAAQSVGDLVATNIEGVAGLDPEHVDKQEHWDWATQWSLSKTESLSLVVPGLFGYQPDSPDGQEYWGKIGRAPTWDRYVESGRQGKPPTGFERYTGAGFYLGISVALVALWGFLQSLRRKESAFTPAQRKLIWFWVVVGVVSLLLAWGRFAPFYRVLYSLPYFSSIRNPIKFLDVLSMAVIVVFAFGVDALCRRYMAPVGTLGMPRWSGLGSWWSRAPKFEKRWLVFCLGLLVVSVAGWMIYASSGEKLTAYLASEGVTDSIIPAVVSFSTSQMVWFVLFAGLTVVWLALTFAGAFAGSNASVGGLLLAALVLVDLGRADVPWRKTYDYQERYASNSVIDHLRDRPWEHRVSIFPFTARGRQILNSIYRYEWLQYQFPYYNIQAGESPQMSRLPEDLAAFQATFNTGTGSNILRTLPRYWQITNTRFVMGPAEMGQNLNQISPGKPWVRLVERFRTALKHPGLAPNRPENVTAVADDNGEFGLFEFMPALPRAVMYSQWQVSTNQTDELKILVSREFDPGSTVLVATNLPPVATNEVHGHVEITSYAPKDITLDCNSPIPSVLLLNDHYDPNWKVFVDDKPDNIFRANFYMRGVFVAAGRHIVEFRYRTRTWPLYITSAGMLMGLLALGTLIGLERRDTPALNPAAPSSKPVTAADETPVLAAVQTPPAAARDSGKKKKSRSG